MNRGMPDERHFDAPALDGAREKLVALAVPFSAQLLARRYQPTRRLTQEEASKARRFRDNLFRRRDSVIHRAHALAWHVHWLFSLYNHHSTGANELEVMLDNARAITALQHAVTDLLFIFDDIMLKGVSLIDYHAQFLACAIAGKGVARWETLVKRVRQQGAGATYGAELASAVVQLDEAWVRRLVDRRNYIAHQTASRARGVNELHLDKLMVTLSVDLPSEARPLLEAIGGAPAEPDFLSGAQHIGLASLRACVQLLTVATTAHNLRPGFVPVVSL